MDSPIITTELSSEFLEEFAAAHSIDKHAVWCVSEKCIEIYDDTFRHYIDGQWHPGKMPEEKTIARQKARTGKLFGRYITKKLGIWYNKDTPIK